MSQDKFALGMVEYKEEDFNSTPDLDSYQYSLFGKYLTGKALELGAGAGRISKLVVGNLNVSEIVLSEPSAYFFDHLVKQVPKSSKLKCIQGQSGELVGKYSNYFDCVYSVDVMEHIENDKRFLNECYEMLKSGGLCIVLVPAVQFLYSNLDKSIGHYRRYDKSLVKKTIAETPFIIESMSYNNFVGFLASLWFIKIKKLDYQSPSNKKQFMFLARVYSRYVIPIVQFVERVVPVPIGLNLTIILRKK